MVLTSFTTLKSREVFMDFRVMVAAFILLPLALVQVEFRCGLSKLLSDQVGDFPRDKHRPVLLPIEFHQL